MIKESKTDVKIAFRKPAYPIIPELMEYLEKYNRTTKSPLLYDDLLRFSGGISVYDKEGNDTLWLRVFYPEFEQAEIEAINYSHVMRQLLQRHCKKTPYHKQGRG